MLFEVTVCGRNDPDVNRDVLGPADHFYRFFLYKPEKFHLEQRGEFADFIEEEGAALGCFDEPFLVRSSAGESAFLVAEQFGLDQVFRDAATVDDHQRFVAPCALAVNGFGHKLFAGAALAGDNHVAAGLGYALDTFIDFVHRRAFSDEAAEIERPFLRFTQYLIVAPVG